MLWRLTLLFVVISMNLPAHAQTWGRLANPGFENQRIKATYFFAGQAYDGTNPSDCNCGPSCPPCTIPGCPAGSPQFYTIRPLDGAHLKWSESPVYRDVALNQMVQARINVVNMSSWGADFLPCAAWAVRAAPMQTSPRSHDQLFAAALGKSLLIIPFLEGRGNDFPWSFRDEFPQTPDGKPAPGTISQIVNLIDRYLKEPDDPEWPSKWARVYDQNGEERYAVGILGASSNRLGSGDHDAFAAGFDAVAKAVFDQTGGEQNGGVKVGFFIDALPPGTNAPGVFKPSSEFTGPKLREIESLLGIECFIPEIWIGSFDTVEVINWKRNFSRGWFETEIPFIMDVSPGYDGHLVFGASTAHRYGFTFEWLCQLAQMVKGYGETGIVFNSWNGYTEAMVAVPSQEYGSWFYDWLRSLQYADVYAGKPDAPAPRNGTWGCPYTLTEAIQNVPVGGIIGLLPSTSVHFETPGTIEKACTLIAIDGSATIGP